MPRWGWVNEITRPYTAARIAEAKPACGPRVGFRPRHVRRAGPEGPEGARRWWRGSVLRGWPAAFGEAPTAQARFHEYLPRGTRRDQRWPAERLCRRERG